MKKVFLVVMVVIGTVFQAKAQDGSPTSKGKYLIEANTGFGGGALGVGHTANTSFGLVSVDGTTIWSVGGEGGYFVADDLAVKVGLGYTDTEGSNVFTYKLGAKYYINSTIPVQLDFTGASIKDNDENPLWMGIQGGYAVFLNDFISVEPGLRYNLSLNKDFTEEGILEFRIGFALHF